MNRFVINTGKALALLMWCSAVLGWWGVIPEPYGTWLIYFGLFSLAAHILEVAYLLVAKGGQLENRLRSGLEVLVFGYFALQPLMTENNSRTIVNAE